MIPIDQTVTGPRGNCMSACIASLLHLPIERVARFIREPGDTHIFQWAERLDDFLEPFGLYALHFAADPERAAFPGVFHIMTGISPRGRPHAVIGKGRRIVHDPHPDKTGLVSIDGFCLLVPTWEGGMGIAPSTVTYPTSVHDQSESGFCLLVPRWESAPASYEEQFARQKEQANASGGTRVSREEIDFFPGKGLITDWDNLRAASDGLVYDAGARGNVAVGRLR